MAWGQYGTPGPSDYTRYFKKSHPIPRDSPPRPGHLDPDDLVTPVFRRDVLPVIQWYDLVTIHLVWPITFPCCQSASFRALHRLQMITVPLMAFSAKRRYRDG